MHLSAFGEFYSHILLLSNFFNNANNYEPVRRMQRDSLVHAMFKSP